MANSSDFDSEYSEASAIIDYMLENHFKFECELAHILQIYKKDTLTGMSAKSLAKFFSNQLNELSRMMDDNTKDRCTNGRTGEKT